LKYQIAASMFLSLFFFDNILAQESDPSPDSLIIIETIDDNFSDPREFRNTLRSEELLRGVADLLWQSTDFLVFSRGTYGSAWYGSPIGLDPRYLTVFTQGRPMRNLRKGKYDLSLALEYNLTETSHESAAGSHSHGEPSLSKVDFNVFPEYRNENISQFVMRRGRGDYDDVNVILTRRLTGNSVFQFQGLIRDQRERDLTVNYDGRKISAIYGRRTDSGWNGSYSLNHTFRRIKLTGPKIANIYRYDTNGSLREVTYDHTLNIHTPKGGTNIDAYLSTSELRRKDNNRTVLAPFRKFDDQSLSYYYGVHLNQKLISIGAGGLYGGIRTELHNIRGGGFELNNLLKSYSYLTLKMESGKFLSIEATEGISTESEFGAVGLFAAVLNLNFSSNTNLSGEISKSAVDVPIDYRLMNNFNFGLSDSLKQETIDRISFGLNHRGNNLKLRAGYQLTTVHDPLVVEALFNDDLRVFVRNDYEIPAIFGEIERSFGGVLTLGASGWQNLDFDPEIPFSRDYKGIAYGSLTHNFFDNNLIFTAHAEEVLLGAGHRFTYDPALDFYISLGGEPLPKVELFNYWFTAKISSLTILFRNDNLFLTPYQLVDGFDLLGNEFFWGIKWDFIN